MKLHIQRNDISTNVNMEGRKEIIWEIITGDDGKKMVKLNIFEAAQLAADMSYHDIKSYLQKPWQRILVHNAMVSAKLTCEEWVSVRQWRKEEAEENAAREGPLWYLYGDEDEINDDITEAENTHPGEEAFNGSVWKVLVPEMSTPPVDDRGIWYMAKRKEDADVVFPVLFVHPLAALQFVHVDPKRFRGETRMEDEVAHAIGREFVNDQDDVYGDFIQVKKEELLARTYGMNPPLWERNSVGTPNHSLQGDHINALMNAVESAVDRLLQVKLTSQEEVVITRGDPLFAPLSTFVDWESFEYLVKTQLVTRYQAHLCFQSNVLEALGNFKKI